MISQAEHVALATRAAVSRRLVMGESTHATSACRVGCHYYASRFGRLPDLSTLWLSAPLSPWHALGCRNGEEYARRRAIHRSPLTLDNCLHYVPWTLLPVADAPLLRSRWVLRNSLHGPASGLRRFLERRGFDRADVLLISHPQMLSLTRLVRHDRLVYRITDRCDAFGGAPRSLAAAHEELTRAADTIVCTAHVLADALPDHARAKALVIPNGVDVDAMAAEAPEPAVLRDVPRPRVVYVGAIDHWFETSWVLAAAKAMPEAQFVLAGPASTDLAALKARPNVRLLQSIDYDQVPGLLRHADVGIVPFDDSPLVQAVSPIKVYEYLAAGLPVVARGWEELRRARLPVAQAGSAEEFVEHLRAALRLGRGATPRGWRAEDHSWDVRFAQLRQACGL